MTQHRCTEELRQLREDASHETTSRTKHWGSPSKNQALGELTPESKLDLVRRLRGDGRGATLGGR